jgi:predicted HAD superfamily Cof-like phosphohydrolase
VNYFEDVQEFMGAAGQKVPLELTVPSAEQAVLRFNMLCSEFAELICAMYGIGPEDVICKGMKYHLKKHLGEFISEAGPVHQLNFVNLGHQIADMHYVLSGASVDFGLPETEVFAEVHRANMAKIGGPKRADGKQLPPPGWTPPNIAAVLDEYAS